jgi:hypothetical protein
MHMFNVMLLAVLLPASGAKGPERGAACRAELHGLKLLTVVQLPGGMVVEGPWRIVLSGEMPKGEAHFVMRAALDRIIERDVVTGVQKVIAFPEPVSLALEGTNQRELVERAAQIWCVTVMRAQENRTLDRLPASQSGRTRIAALPRTQPRG